MIVNKKKFLTGLAMIAIFMFTLALLFTPIFGDQNGLNYLDSLYNSISKGSAYKNIEKLRKGIATFDGKKIAVTVTMRNEEEARQASLLFQKAHAMVTLRGKALAISGDLGKILTNCLEDTDLMYVNKGRIVSEKYGYDEKQALYNWWVFAKEMDEALKKQKSFKAAKVMTALKERAIEMTYNYYGITPQQISEKYGMVIFSLIFYIIYTLWYGYAIMYMFEGLGIQLDH